MNYKEKIVKYIGLTGLFAILWQWLNRHYLSIQDKTDIFSLLIGTHGGYGYYLLLASIFMVLFLLMLTKEVKLFDLAIVSRVGRQKVFCMYFCKLMKLSFGYAITYVIVQVFYALIYVDWKILVENNFFMIMILYTVAVSMILGFGGMVYFLVEILSKKFVLSLLISVGINMGLAYFNKSVILYGGLAIVDEMEVGIIWILSELVNLCIIGILYFITQAIYFKKDLL